MRRYSARERAGAVLLDLPRLLWALRSRNGWMRYGNRGDILRPAPAGPGTACGWEFTRTLHVCDVFPRTGNWLLRRALRSHPIRFAETPAHGTEAGGPEVSFIIGHRGRGRLPHLLLTLRTLAAQQRVRVECIVVEQDVQPAARDHLPGWIRYLHQPALRDGQGFSRSRAFNAGAAVARGRILVLHDNDLLIPSGYAAEAVWLAAAGYEVINHKRFLFYLPEQATVGCMASRAPPRLSGMTPEQVLENATGGGSLAVTKQAFESIGRMDESFKGWGGEDVEFWQRAQTRRVWNSGFLPLVHLWHSAQEGKYPAKQTPGMERLRQLSAIPPEQRIESLRSKGGGA